MEHCNKWYQIRRSSDCVVDEAPFGWKRLRQEDAAERMDCLNSVLELFNVLRAEIRNWRSENEEWHNRLLSDLHIAQIAKRTDLAIGESSIEVVEKDDRLAESQFEDEKPALGKECARKWRRRQRRRKLRRWKQPPLVLVAVEARFIAGRRSCIPCVNRCRSGKIRLRNSDCPSNRSGILHFRIHFSKIILSCYECSPKFYYGCYDWLVYLMISGSTLVESDSIVKGVSGCFNWDPGGVKVVTWPVLLVWGGLLVLFFSVIWFSSITTLFGFAGISETSQAEVLIDMDLLTVILYSISSIYVCECWNAFFYVCKAMQWVCLNSWGLCDLIDHGVVANFHWNPGGVVVLRVSRGYFVRECFENCVDVLLVVEDQIKAPVGYFGGIFDVESQDETLMNQFSGNEKCNTCLLYKVEVRLKKVYRNFMMRSKFVDCAVLIEKQGWMLLDYAVLKQTSVSFFDIGKLEPDVSHEIRVIHRASKVAIDLLFELLQDQSDWNPLVSAKFNCREIDSAEMVRLNWLTPCEDNDDIISVVAAAHEWFLQFVQKVFDNFISGMIMTMFTLTTSLADMRDRLERMVFGNSKPGEPITANDQGIWSVLTILVKEAINTTLIHTLEGGFEVTEAGFGAENFMSIKCRCSGLTPHCVVIVTTSKEYFHEAVQKVDSFLCNFLEDDYVDIVMDETRELLEKLNLRRRKLLIVLQTCFLRLKIKKSAVMIYCQIKSSCLLPNSTCQQHCIQDFGGLDQNNEVSVIKETILRDRREDLSPKPDHLLKIVEFLCLQSSQEILSEIMALEKERSNSYSQGSKEDMIHIEPKIDLISHICRHMIAYDHLSEVKSMLISSVFFCQFFLEVMNHHVLVPSGQTYEKSTFQRWFDQRRIYPIIRQDLFHINLYPNYTMKALIAHWHGNKYLKQSPEKSIIMRKLFNLDAVNWDKQTPLMPADMTGKIACVLGLVQTSANILTFNSTNGRTCLHYTVYYGHSYCLRDTLAAADSSHGFVLWGFARFGNIRNAGNYECSGSTHLHLVAWGGFLACVRPLLTCHTISDFALESNEVDDSLWMVIEKENHEHVRVFSSFDDQFFISIDNIFQLYKMVVGVDGKKELQFEYEQDGPIVLLEIYILGETVMVADIFMPMSYDYKVKELVKLQSDSLPYSLSSVQFCDHDLCLEAEIERKLVSLCRVRDEEQNGMFQVVDKYNLGAPAHKIRNGNFVMHHENSDRNRMRSLLFETEHGAIGDVLSLLSDEFYILWMLDLCLSNEINPWVVNFLDEDLIELEYFLGSQERKEVWNGLRSGCMQGLLETDFYCKFLSQKLEIVTATTCLTFKEEMPKALLQLYHFFVQEISSSKSCLFQCQPPLPSFLSHIDHLEIVEDENCTSAIWEVFHLLLRNLHYAKPLKVGIG